MRIDDADGGQSTFNLKVRSRDGKRPRVGRLVAGVVFCGLVTFNLAGVGTEPVGTRAFDSQSRQRANQPKVTVVDAMPPPTTLRGMWDSASVVVQGVVTTTSPPTLVGNGPLVARVHGIRVLEVLKSASTTLQAGPLRVRQFGGTVVVSNEEVSTKFPEVILRTDGVYVLFLAPIPSSEVYEIVFGSAGAFSVDQAGMTVRLPEAVRQRMPEFSGRQGMDKEELLKLIRSYRAK